MREDHRVLPGNNCTCQQNYANFHMVRFHEIDTRLGRLGSHVNFYVIFACVNPLMPEQAKTGLILLCLTPDDFTHQWGTPGVNGLNKNFQEVLEMI